MNNFCSFLFAHEQHSSLRQESTFKGKKQILFLLEFTPIEKGGKMKMVELLPLQCKFTVTP